MGQIKNRAGQVFADFNEWKKWAEQPSNQHPGYNNVLPELVEFLGFYPHLLDSSVSEQVELCTEKSPVEFNDKSKGFFGRAFRLCNILNILKTLSPDFALRYEMHAIMDLEQKVDGTYRLKALNNFNSDNYIKFTIPEFVTEIDADALATISFAEINFPDTFNAKNKITLSLLEFSGNGPSINTIHPIDIAVNGASLDKVVNGRFDIKYTTFKSLCELYPAAFKPNQEGKVWADNSAFCTRIGGGSDYKDVMIMLSESEKFVQMAPNTMYPPKSYALRRYDGHEMEVHQFDEENSKQTLTPKQFDDARIVAVELIAGRGEKKPAVIPDTVDTLFVNCNVDELIIEGNPQNIFFKNKLAGKKVVVNAGIQEVSKALLEYYKLPRGKNAEQIIFNVPALCEEQSIIPGYIRATLAYLDEYEVYDVISEINTKYIVSMHPEEIILRNKPVVGTRIHMASNDIERHQTLVVYEPMEMIAEKIKNAYVKSKESANNFQKN